MSTPEELRRIVTWVEVGPPPNIARCVRCQASHDMSPFSRRLREWLNYGDTILALHMSCKEPEAAPA